MTTAIVKTQPLNKASSDIREICNPGILAGIPGMGTYPAKPDPAQDTRLKGRATPHGRAGPTQGTTPILLQGHCLWKNMPDSVVPVGKGRSGTEFHHIKH